MPISYIGNLKEQIDSVRPMTFEEQIALVFRLKERLQVQDDPDDMISLLRRLKQREDLFAKTDKEIDAVLASAVPAPLRKRLLFPLRSRLVTGASTSVRTCAPHRTTNQRTVPEPATGQAVEQPRRLSLSFFLKLAAALMVI